MPNIEYSILNKQVWCATTKSDNLEGGKYYRVDRQKPLLPIAKDEGKAKALWELSEKLIEKALNNNV